MEVSELNERIKKGNFSGRYIFGGEEDYLKRFYRDELVRVAIGGGDDIFSHTVFDQEATAKDVAEAIISPSLMSEYKVVEWRFPSFTSMREKELAATEELAELQESNPDTVLILTVTNEGFEFGQGKTKSKLERRFGKLFELINFKKSTDRQLLSWLNKHFIKEGINADAKALHSLLLRSGKNMDVLANEVLKLSSLLKSRGSATLTEAEVKEAASETPESETFAFQNAIVNKDKSSAFKALDELKFKRTDPNIILAIAEKSISELLNTAMLIKDGDEDKLDSLLGIRDFKARLCIGGAKRWGAEKLSLAAGELVRLDAASKFGGISGYKMLEIFISEYL